MVSTYQLCLNTGEPKDRLHTKSGDIHCLLVFGVTGRTEYADEPSGLNHLSF